MKITKVDIMTLHTKRKGGVVSWRPVVCRIYTDEGIFGDGEAALAYGVASPAAMGMIQDLSRLIIGMDPLDNEVIWEKLYKRTFWAQNGGPIIFSGMSAIDLALWDIKGKYLTSRYTSFWAASIGTSCAATPASCSSAGATSRARLWPTRRSTSTWQRRPWQTAMTA